MKIICYNVNGIRSARKKGLVEFIKQQNPDVICLQEVKAQKSRLTTLDFMFDGYSNPSWAEAKKSGYSGVAVWVREGLEVVSVTESLGASKFDDEGRTIIVDFVDFYLINSYYPNGREDHSRVEYKLEYSYQVLAKSKELEKNKPVILTGDFNTAHHEIDLARPSENLKTTGFLPNERKFLTKLEEENFFDAFRRKYGPQENVYSWWSYRTAAKTRNVGWRIDYFWVSEALAPIFKDCYYCFKENASDHCPVVLELHEK